MLIDLSLAGTPGCPLHSGSSPLLLLIRPVLDVLVVHGGVLRSLGVWSHWCKHGPAILDRLIANLWTYVANS